MGGITRDITPDARPSLIARHLPGTPQVQRLLRQEGKAHVFTDRATLERVTATIIESGNTNGN
jgi:molybdopterin biosynthesis enzyme MoaB